MFPICGLLNLQELPDFSILLPHYYSTENALLSAKVIYFEKFRSLKGFFNIMWCQKQYLKNFKKVENGNFLLLQNTSRWFLTQTEVNILMIYINDKVGIFILFFNMNFFVSVEVFFIFVGKLVDTLFCIKFFLRQCIHLYDKYKDRNSFDRFLKHSSFGDILILLFGCSYISYAAE